MSKLVLGLRGRRVTAMIYDFADYERNRTDTRTKDMDLVNIFTVAYI